ncbi:MAG: hypothetical protein LC104_18760, partial [Bacteroidales bacterium]|nr:hypothetical protein [Bacteroidales bacterium]
MNWRQNLRHRLSRHILTVTTRIGVLLLLTQAATAAPPAPGILNVRDDAKLFTAKGVAAAQSQFEKTTFPQSTHLTFATVQAIPAEKQAEFDKAVKNSLSRGQFFDAWARELAKKDQETGVFVLMFDDGKRFITRVVADRLSSGARGFTSADAQTLTQTLNAGSQAALNKPTEEAQSLRDEALLKAVDFVAQQLLAAPQSGKVAQSNKAQNAAEPGKAAQASPLMGWLCMG